MNTRFWSSRPTRRRSRCPDLAQDRVTRLLNRGRQAIGLPTAAPGAQVTAHFAPIHQLMAGQPGAAPIDRVLEKMQQLQQQLSPVGSRRRRHRSVAGDHDGWQRRTRQVAAAGCGHAAASRGRSGDANRRPRRRQRRGRMFAASWTTRYQQEVVRPCTELLDGRYPLVADGTDAPLADFGRVFGYNGVFDGFFKQHLEALVLTTGPAWRWRTDASGRRWAAPWRCFVSSSRRSGFATCSSPRAPRRRKCGSR